jgi:addiction module RelE/StbE family toxin
MARWTEKAKGDLYEIHSYISLHNPDAANKVIADLFETAEQIDDNPFIGRIFNNLFDENVREVIHKKYRIIYEVIQENNVTILQILHVRRLV